MSVYALPALIALFSKLWVYMLARNAKQSSTTFLCLLVIFAMHNLSEFLVIIKLFSDSASESLLKTYYAAVIFALSYLCVFAMSVANEKEHKPFYYSVVGVAAVVSIVILVTDFIIAGAVSVGYTVTALKGEYYFVFQLLALLSLAFIVTVLVLRYKNTLDLHSQLKCFYALFALSPIVIISLVVLGMMQIGFQYTGAILLPFASTAFLVLLVLSEKDHDLIKVRHRLPFSREKAVEKQVAMIVRQHLQGELEFSSAKSEIEKVLIQNSLDEAQDNVSHAANRLGIKRSSFYSILARLDIKRV